MFSIYQLQFPILHAKCMILGMDISFHIAAAWMIDITLIKEEILKRLVYYLLPLNFFFLFYSICMIKGVSYKLHFNFCFFFLMNINYIYL